MSRQNSKVFAGKHGFITSRDLFRWADRFRTFKNSYEDLARDSYYLLTERLRDEGEKKVVLAVLEKHLWVFLIVGSHGIPPWGYIHSTEHGPERFQS